MRNAYKNLVKHSGEKTPHERPRHRREDNTVTDLIWREAVNWIIRIWIIGGRAFINSVMNLRDP
jgi:uncharacterized membrane protein